MLKHVQTLAAVIVASLVVAAGTVWSGENDPSPEREKELIAILTSDAPGGEKAIACKRLTIHGSDAAVPELAKLLSNPQLASWARIALEAIPGNAANEALKTAVGSLEGNLLVGTVNSIGVRRDASAVELLTGLLKNQNPDAAAAAAVALGRIGTAEAAKSLQAALAVEDMKVRSAVAEGCVLCGEAYLAAGKNAEAVAIYDEIRKADVPSPRVIEATRGAIVARKDEGIPILVELLQSTDKGLFNIALSTARELPGDAIDKALASEIGKATPGRAALIIYAMADRKETVVLPAVLEAAASGPKPARLAALSALGRVGNESCLSALLKSALDADKELQAAAKAALADLPGEKVNAAIVAQLAKAEGDIYPVLIGVVGQRRIEATDALLKAVDNSDKTVRAAALAALGETVAPEGLSVLITRVVSPKHPEDQSVAEKALTAASVRMPDREACAKELAAAMEKAPVAAKTALLQILGAVGGTKALETLGAAAKTNNLQLQEASSQLLGEWMTADAAPVLLDLAKSAPGDKYKVRAMRGYIRIARQFVLGEEERAKMCETALAAADRLDEKKLVIDILKRYANAHTFKLAVKTAQENAQLKDDASEAALVIAQKLGNQTPEVKDALSKLTFDKVKLEIVKAEYGAGATQKDVTEVLKKQLADIRMIALPGKDYNTSFGGDPAPDVKKQLKVQYKLNGKAGEAVIAENALIILPVPK